MKIKGEFSFMVQGSKGSRGSRGKGSVRCSFFVARRVPTAEGSGTGQVYSPNFKKGGDLISSFV